MTPIEQLQKRVEQRFGDAQCELDVPAAPEGRWFLDVSLGEQVLVVEWRPDRGFGISTPVNDAFGAGPDEVYPDLESVWERVRALLLSGTSTHSPEARLPALRSLIGMTQAELAERLHVQQAAVSKLERRDDMMVSTLANVVAALGGTLEIRARFPGGVVRVLELGGPDQRLDDNG
jgi:DNA-binding XRE family transcriptional regulator